jgi:SAM-dependent methyltransferase
MTIGAMDTLQSYDELPYDSLPLPETQPDFLAAVARLHGFDAPDPAHARILELGCACGGNLIPIAWRWPESHCVGVELSRVQAEAGADFIRELGLPNVCVMHGDLAALPADLGEFDYIIAHGVFSWVPPTVRDALLDLCRRHLSPRGVAYISFNVAAGWHALEPLRAALLAGTRAELPAPARYAEALRVLDELEAQWTDPALLKEIAYLKSAAPSYLFHEYLAEFNVPLDFAAFAAQLDRHGLRYVGEAGPRHAVVEIEDARGLSAARLVGRWRDAEAALDQALTTRFRRALIARDDAPAARPAQPDALSGLAFYADLSSDEDLDLDQATEQCFVNPAGNTFPVSLPAIKAALMALSARYPAAMAYADLRAAADAVIADYGAGVKTDDGEFRAALFQLVIAHAVMPTLIDSGPAAQELGSHPCADPLARLQARSPGWVVSGRRHVAIDLDAAGRALLALLDGSRTLPDLVCAMQAWLGAAGFDLPVDRVGELTARQLWLFARQGLLSEP